MSSITIVPKSASVMASRCARLQSFAALASAAVATFSAEGAVHSVTGLDVGVGLVGGISTNRALTVTDGGGATVATLSLRSSYAATLGGNWIRRVAITGVGVQFRTMSQSALAGTLHGGVPVLAGASWSAIGRTASEFIDLRAFGTGADGGVNLSTSAWSDFHQAAGGVTSYLLFRFSQGGNDRYGWISFTASIEGFGGDDNLIRITGWGWDDSGQTIAAGFTGQAVPATGLAAVLASGAAGFRRRRLRTRGPMHRRTGRV